ncbi:unnamed protein product, partial [Brassica oleracea var. botrytis]
MAHQDPTTFPPSSSDFPPPRTPSLTDPHSNPLYVHHADHADGTFPELDASHPDYGSWSRCNNILCTWLVNAVEKPIAKSIMYLTTARQMWLDIHDQFKKSDGPSTAEIKQQIYAEVQGSQTVSEYYTRLKQLWEDLKNHESPYICCCANLECDSSRHIAQRDEQDRVLKFLMGLNDS